MLFNTPAFEQLVDALRRLPGVADVILTNPPFGGEEEVGIKANFPPNMQTAETALLFLQYIMRKLRVAGAPIPGSKPAACGCRAAVVVPNGTLFGDGISAALKQHLPSDWLTTMAPATETPCKIIDHGDLSHMVYDIDSFSSLMPAIYVTGVSVTSCPGEG